ncbi:MAG: preprotein translocase subunit SecY [Rickettsiales bacterium]|jgi:preprotein translocase subunit SecY|nr:preprotein translocase subunit SecY [Rickettsiales bacterium]
MGFLGNANLVDNKDSVTQLKNKILFTIFALTLYRLGTYLPLPGINPDIFKQITEQNQSGVLGMLNMFSGGALGRMTIFALNVIPFITASIIMQLVSAASPQLSEMKKSGEEGRKKFTQLTRYFTVFLCLFQSYGISVGLESMSVSAGAAVMYPGVFFKITTVFALTGSVFFLIWLGDQITNRGIGNGISLIIFAGIVSELPSAFISTFELGRTGVYSTLFILFVIAIVITMILIIVFFERSFRKVVIQYPNRSYQVRGMNNDSSYLPLKLNTAGVIPPIFASSLLLFPITIVSFGQEASTSGVASFVSRYLVHGKPLFMLLYSALIMFFCFFYTALVFNSSDTADHLKKSGGFVPGVRPGTKTAEYLDNLLSRLTFVGALYMIFVCIVPEIIIAKYSIPFYLGGTSLLIVVNVAIDTLSNVQTHMLSSRYNQMKKNKIRVRR